MRLLFLATDNAESDAVLRACAWAAKIERSSSLASALEFLERETVDAVLSSLDLPDARGVPIVEALHAARPDLAIVALRSTKASPLELLRAGAQDCLDRADTDHVERQIQHAVARQRAQEHKSALAVRGQAMREQLAMQERLTALGQLAAGVAHEINNPAAYVLSSLEASLDEIGSLRRESDSLQAPGFLDARLQRVHRKLELAFEGMRRIQSVMRELRSFGRTDLVSEPFQLADAVDSAVRLVKNQVDQVASLEVAIDRDFVVTGTPDAIKQVVTNLVLNAAQAFERSRPDENLIRVNAQARDGMVRVTVHDNGPGVPPALRSRIFEPFVTTKAAKSGMGLGLSICRDIAIRHGGSLELLDSEDGACFLLVLPLSQKTAKRVPPDQPPVRAGRLDRKPVVLLVEDEPHVRLSFASALSGYAEVLTADSGMTATDLVRGTELDAILCDLAMPRMSGPEFYAWLEEHNPPLCKRVVFVTGGAFSARAEAFLQTHDVPVVHKPCTRRELREAIEKVVGRAEMKRPARPQRTARPRVG